MGRVVLAAAAAALILAAGLAVAAFVMPAGDRAEQAERQGRVEEAVRQIVEREAAVHAESGAFAPIAPADIEQDRNYLDLPWRGFPIGDYVFEAEPLPSGNLRVRAAPRPESVQDLDAAPQFYVAEIAPGGEILAAGWQPEGR